jgi:phospholipid/cholesterol/gamma-HCH transport system substrate-binding protein
MKLELTRRGVAGVALFAVASAGVLLFMLGRLGAVPLPGSSGRTARAVVANAEGLPVQADVLVHGVKVGSVSGISADGSRTLITLALNGSAPRLRRDASIRIGFKTPLGEPFVDLDPGRMAAAERGLLRVRPTVEIDDALSFLDAQGRANARAALTELGRGASAPDTSQELGDSLGQLERTTASIGRLAATLRAQRGDLSAIVGDGRTALDVLASRGAELHGLTADADRVLSALATQRSALGAVLERMPTLLRTAEATLSDAPPLIAVGRRVAGELTTAAPALTGALRALPATAGSLSQTLSHAGAVRRTLLPALGAVRHLASPSSQALSLLGPALADAVPIARYLGPRGNTIAAWFSNTADLGSHGDAKGDWARFFVMFDPATLFGVKSTSAPPGNSYTAPDDAAHNQAYRPGGYPRLMPYPPALAK